LLGAAEAVPAALPPCRAECCRASGAKRSNRRRVVIARTTTLVAVALLGAAWRLRPQSPPPVVTAKRQVTFAGNVENSAIFPDGRFLACATHAEDSLLIFVQEVSGGNAIRIAALEHTDVESLRWSPDGARLLITGVVGTSPIAYVVARLGGDRRPIPFVTLLNDMVPFGVWMPDGQHVALWSRTRSQLRLGCLARGNYAALNATVLQLPPAGRAGRNDLQDTTHGSPMRRCAPVATPQPWRVRHAARICLPRGCRGAAAQHGGGSRSCSCYLSHHIRVRYVSGPCRAMAAARFTAFTDCSLPG
jgi:hypothetical protein